MSYLSASENVGFSGLPQNISEASCATQYKMAVDGVPAVCSEVNTFMSDSQGEEYIQHINDNYFHSKFKIDPNDLYTFHDSDIIAGEITVSHTDDAFIYTDSDDAKKLDEDDFCIEEATPEIKDVINFKEEVVTNGHYNSLTETPIKDENTAHTKAPKIAKTPSQLAKDVTAANSLKSSVNNSKCPIVSNSLPGTDDTKNSINNVTTNSKGRVTGNETFLDVFKREVLVGSKTPKAVVKEEPVLPPPAKAPSSGTLIKKSTSARPSTKPRKGRGPIQHEALQRISKRAIPVANRPWRAPGDELFDCGPLDARAARARLDSSGSDDDEQAPNIGRMCCVEESAAGTRGARLALRRAALRRAVARAAAAVRLAPDHRRQRRLATVVKKQLQRPCRGGLPTATVNRLLALRGMPALFTPHERRALRSTGWSGGEHAGLAPCTEEQCGRAALPCAAHCLAHVSRAGQRLYAACSAVFAGGGRCSQPLLPLADHTLCAEHARKRDNYDKQSREVKPRKTIRARSWSAARDAKRRRLAAPAADHALSELNACSNSSAYDSAEESPAALGGEFISPVAAHDLEVGQVPPDDILDPAVLSQIPDEAFTEFFNQAEGAGGFAGGSELARALEAVLDERALDALDAAPQLHARKVQVSSYGVEMPSSISS